MKNRSSVFSVLTATVLSVSIGAMAATCPTYNYNNVVVEGSSQTDAYAINDKGAIAGDYIANGVQHGMILKGSELRTIDNPNCASGITFFGINSAGTVAGTCTGKATNSAIAFTWSKGKFTTISPPGAVSASAVGINDSNDVVGNYADSSGALHGFVLIGKKYTTLDPMGDGGASQVAAWSINNSKVITIYFFNGVFSSFTTANGGKTYQTVSYSGAAGAGTDVHTINNHGDIVATYYDSSDGPHGILFHDGLDCLIDDPDANEMNGTRPDGLNDSLEVVGHYGNLSGTFSFIAIPD